MKSELQNFEYLWNGTSSGWVLVRNEDPSIEVPYSVFNKVTRHLLLVDDDSVYDEICNMMLSKGIEVLAHIPVGEFNVANLNIQDE